MLEQAYADQSQGPAADPGQKSRRSKKRKTETMAASAAYSGLDDEDDVYYASVGKKAKGGVGYAGEQREDVSTGRNLRVLFITIFGRCLDNWKLRRSSVIKTRRSAPC